MHSKHYERDQLIYWQRVKDKRKFHDIGSEHGISVERVRQIVAKQHYLCTRPPSSKREMNRLWAMRFDLIAIALGVTE